MDIKGHTVERGLDREGLRHRRGVLRQLHPRPLGQEAPRACSRPRAASRSRRWPRPNPDAIAKIWIDPVDGLTEDGGPRAGSRRPKLDPAATEGAVDILRKLYTAYTEGDADLVEINPLILTPDGRGPRPRRQGHPRRQRRVPPRVREYEATQERDEREQAAHEKGLQYVGLDGYGRHHRQRRRAGHVHRRRRQPGRRQPGQLPRHRRRRQRRRHGRRARGHQQRPRGAGRSSSTSSAASPRATRWPTASSRPWTGSTSTRPIVIRLDGTNADEGRAILEPHLSDKLQIASPPCSRPPQAVVGRRQPEGGDPT